jgi:RNA polymerase sigma-70 factor (ECF subfamily)
VSALAAAVRLARRPAAREAGRETFAVLYRDNRDDVYAYVATLLRDQAAAEDVTATAFERAYRRHAQFDARRGSPRSWVFGIARNAALDELRRRKRHAALPLDPAEEDAPPAGDAGEDDPARRATVRAALESLKPRDREVVALKFGAGLTNVELARVLGLSESNAGTLVHRAMTKLREACHVPA